MLSMGATVPQVDGQGETEEALIQKRSYDYYQDEDPSGSWELL